MILMIVYCCDHYAFCSASVLLACFLVCVRLISVIDLLNSMPLCSLSNRVELHTLCRMFSRVGVQNLPLFHCATLVLMRLKKVLIGGFKTHSKLNISSPQADIPNNEKYMGYSTWYFPLLLYRMCLSTCKWVTRARNR
jgi:hypothetical protein